MQDENQAIEALAAQRTSLQLLVSELLLENQNLRMTIAKLQQTGAAGRPNAPATHPQPRQDH
jgi:hypothetical protein